MDGSKYNTYTDSLSSNPMHGGPIAQIQLQFYLELPPEAHIHHIPQHFIGYRKKLHIPMDSLIACLHLQMSFKCKNC